MYCVDEVSRYTYAGVSKNKEASNVAKIILDGWCMDGLGYPSKKFFMDNGSEFKKQYLEELARKVGVEISLTPSYSPFSNGLCKRRHGVIDLTIKKLLDDDKNLKKEYDIKHAVWTRNQENGQHGMSPHQVLYGRAATIPGIMDGNILTDGPVSDAEIIRLHFRRQQKAQDSIRAADADKRFKEALKARVQPYHDAVYDNGDKMVFQ